MECYHELQMTGKDHVELLHLIMLHVKDYVMIFLKIFIS